MKKKSQKEIIINDFRCKLGFKLYDIIMCKEESVTIKIIKVFSNEKILLQHSVLNYQIDLYFSEHKLAIEVDEKGHTDRDEKKENEREEKIKKELGCKFIRINPDAENYDIFVKIGKINDFIAQSNKGAETKEIKEKVEKEKEAEIKELKDKNKELKTKIKNSTTNQITNNFRKIIKN